MRNPITHRPEPVMHAATLAGMLITLVKILLALFVSFGLIDLTDQQETLIVAAVTILVDLSIVLGTMWFGARNKVTPLEDPVDERGQPLIRGDWQ